MLPTLRIGMVGHGFMGKVHGHAYRSLGFYYLTAQAIDDRYDFHRHAAAAALDIRGSGLVVFHLLLE